jgi:putative membrane protein
VHDFEHASFVVAGFLVWSLLIDPAGSGHLSRGRRLAVAACVFAMGTVISDILIFSLHPLYPAYADQAERVFSLSALRDQQLAGLVMSVEQILTLGTFAGVMLVPAIRNRRRQGEFVAGRERLA